MFTSDIFKPVPTRQLTKEEMQKLKDVFRREVDKAGLSYNRCLYKFRQQVLEREWKTESAYNDALVEINRLIHILKEENRVETETQNRSTNHGYKDKKVTYSVAGVIGNIPYESVFYNSEPAFLLLQNERFSIVSKISAGIELLPLKKEMFPYRPYSLDDEKLAFLNSWKLNVQELYDEIYREYDTFLDVDPKFKALNSIQTMESYQQSKLMTTSYLYHHGDNGSGKTRVLDLHNGLDYRPLFSSSLPAADVYTYLGYHEEGCGTTRARRTLSTHKK